MNQPQFSRIFAVKTTGGQEKTVAQFIETRVKTRTKPVYSVLVLDALKGYVFLEASNAQIVSDTTAGFKHVKSQVPGIVQHQDIEKFLITKSIIAELSLGDTVEITAGPFKGMRARINRIEPARQEATVILMDAPYQLPVTVDANFLKIVEKAKAGVA